MANKTTKKKSVTEQIAEEPIVDVESKKTDRPIMAKVIAFKNNQAIIGATIDGVWCQKRIDRGNLKDGDLVEF